MKFCASPSFAREVVSVLVKRKNLFFGGTAGRNDPRTRADPRDKSQTTESLRHADWDGEKSTFPGIKLIFWRYSHVEFGEKAGMGGVFDEKK
jgi:hypothetical protein